MAPNLMSRLLPASNGSPSIYETLQQYDESSDDSDIEQRIGMALDEENLAAHLPGFDPNDARLQVSARMRPGDTKVLAKPPGLGLRGKRTGVVDLDDADDEVPASLLIEGNNQTPANRDVDLPSPQRIPHPSIPVAGPATATVRDQWKATQIHQRLHPGEGLSTRSRVNSNTDLRGLSLADPKQKAMWRWANVENLDNFLTEVYMYFLGNGFLSILLHRALSLLTFVFVAGFMVFLGNCVNYDKLRKGSDMSKIILSQCGRQMSGGASFLVWLLSLFWLMKLFQYLLDIRRLWNLHNFYRHLLGVSDSEIQSISWQEIVSRLMALRDANPSTAAMLPAKHRRFLGSQSKQRMDAHDIANRLMRKENYLIALFNKDVLDLTLSLPLIGKRQLFSHTLEWNINQCVIDYVFNEQGQVKTLFLKDTHRKALSDGLQRRFKFAAILNIIVAPFLVAYFVIHYFFSYFTEFQRNPSQIGSRQYNPLAEWKFREFNELWHLFQRRINMSYPFASRYIDQFPKDKTAQLSRFVAFVFGALASILAVASLVDPDMFLNFEITKDRSVIFYLGVFGSIWAVARGMVPEGTLVYEPEFALQEVIDFTHYKPSHWDNRLHSDSVRKEFAALYQMKLLIFLQEILSMIFTPFVLWFSLSQCSDRIIDFFREFTVHVDGLGYVCSFAEFNFQRQGNLAHGLPSAQQGPHTRPPGNGAAPMQGLREDYYATKDQKLEASYWGFMNDYARNPKTDIRFPYANSRRRFNPPPPFPGPLSPVMPSDGAGLNVATTGTDQAERSTAYRRSPRYPPGQGSALRARSRYNTGLDPTTEALHEGTSPLTSILLDPHHQPSISGSKLAYVSPQRAQKAPVQSMAKGPSFDEYQDNDITKKSNDEQGIVTSGENILGSSWKMGHDDTESEEGEDVTAVVGDKGPGVLGMIKHFQRAQGGKRGTI